MIKVEPPDGELARLALPLDGDDSVYFASHNRGKRSITLDLKSPRGSEALKRLIAQSDVLLTNYTRDVPTRLGFGFDDVHAINPRIVMTHVTGFGQNAKNPNRRALDTTIQALSGIPDYTGTADSGPILVGAFLPDHIAAYNAALGTMMALRRRDLTGSGELVDVSMLHAYTATVAHAYHVALKGQPLPRVGNLVPTALTRSYQTADGGHVILAPLGRKKWEQFRNLIGLQGDIANLPYEVVLQEHRVETENLIADWVVRRDRDDVIALMDKNGITCGAILTSAEAAIAALDRDDGDLVTVTAPSGGEINVPGPWTNVGLSQSQRRLRIPVLGEDTQAVLSEIGME